MSDPKPKLLVTFATLDSVLSDARRDFEVLSLNGPSANEVLEVAVRERPLALLVAGGIQVDDAFLARLPASVKIIATCSVGYDHLDVKAASRRQIAMTNTPDVLSNATADLALFLLLGACRRGKEYVQVMNEGWGRKFGQGDLLGVDVSGKTLGIYGMGRIGQAVAQRARGFGMKILYCNRHRLPAELELGAKYFAKLHEMLGECDILSLHAPSTAETADVINEKSLSLMRKGAVLVNVARGSLVDEEALYAALINGRLFAAGLDVFKNEPNANTRLTSLPNVIAAPHMGSATIETRFAMGKRALENIRAVRDGHSPRDLIGGS